MSSLLQPIRGSSILTLSSLYLPDRKPPRSRPGGRRRSSRRLVAAPSSSTCQLFAFVLSAPIPATDLNSAPLLHQQHVQAIPTSLCHQSSWQVQMLVHAEQALDLSPAVCREGGNYLQFSSTSTKVEDRVLEATSWIEERFLKVNEEGWPAGISMGWT